MNTKGVTLVELLIVIAIISILVFALGFEYSGWIGRYRVETTVKELHTDLMEARALAMQRNRMYFATFPSATTYSIFQDANDNGALDDAALPSFPKTMQYAITGGAALFFDKRGMISSAVIPTTMRFTTTNDADYDCIVIASTRINMGRWNATTLICDIK